MKSHHEEYLHHRHRILFSVGHTENYAESIQSLLLPEAGKINAWFHTCSCGLFFVSVSVQRRLTDQLFNAGLSHFVDCPRGELQTGRTRKLTQ